MIMSLKGALCSQDIYIYLCLNKLHKQSLKDNLYRFTFNKQLILFSYRKDKYI